MAEIVLYRFCSMSSSARREHLRELIVERKLYFSDPSKFNDPFDCNIGLEQRGALRVCGVLSLSMEGCDDVLMFSHYADNHRGARLHFTIDDDQTIGETVPFNGSPVEYTDRIPAFIPKNARMTLLTKSRKWAYENEYRVFKTVEDGNRTLNFSKNQLHAITFGLHMPEEDESLIREWIKEGCYENIRLFRATLHKNRFEIHIEPTD